MEVSIIVVIIGTLLAFFAGWFFKGNKKVDISELSNLKIVNKSLSDSNSALADARDLAYKLEKECSFTLTAVKSQLTQLESKYRELEQNYIELERDLFGANAILTETRKALLESEKTLAIELTNRAISKTEARKRLAEAVKNKGFHELILKELGLIEISTVVIDKYLEENTDEKDKAMINEMFAWMKWTGIEEVMNNFLSKSQKKK